MENLRNLCVKLTEKNINNLESKYYINGNEKKVGDLVLYVMLIDDLEKSGNYHCVPLNINDIGKGYEFTGEFYDEKNDKSDFYFPIVKGKFIQPKVTSLKEFNDYMRLM